jgi:serine/threonine protein kinase
MPLSNGEAFTGFRIVRLLGSGGMGDVYLAQHPRLPRHDALKVLPKDVSADPEYRERFLREADLAAALWHPNIVGVHDRGEHEGLRKASWRSSPRSPAGSRCLTACPPSTRCSTRPCGPTSSD